ncbi:DNA-binding protein [Pseudomonas sp. TTU2014-096BSC]|nr:DNA-binding protein [Pseudomonas sp. TTU2014-096BSC]
MVWSPKRILLQEALKQIRLDAQLTQAELAAKLQKPQSYVSKYESGERRLDLIELRDICATLGLTLVAFCDLFEELMAEQGY